MTEKSYNAFCHFKYRKLVSGKGYWIKRNARIKAKKRGAIELGKVLINENAFLCSSGNGKIIIEDNVTINRNTIIVSKELIEIGMGTSIGPNVCIYDHNHIIKKTGFDKDEFVTSPIKIGKNVWIGAGVILLKGCEIGDNSIVAAGTVVDFHVPSNSIVRRNNNLVIEEMRVK